MFPQRTVDDIALEHSFKNFHAKGLDYLCLKRTQELTVKVYFFDGDADLSALPEIVMPHDHRYDFESICVAGEVTNKEYSEVSGYVQRRPAYSARPEAERYEKFAWDTPLNGGAGFSHVGEAFLTVPGENSYKPGQAWASRSTTLHTLRIDRPGTIVGLVQHADQLPFGVPTYTFRRAAQKGDIKPPELAGLYETMPPDYAAKRLAQFQEALKRMP